MMFDEIDRVWWVYGAEKEIIRRDKGKDMHERMASVFPRGVLGEKYVNIKLLRRGYFKGVEDGIQQRQYLFPIHHDAFLQDMFEMSLDHRIIAISKSPTNNIILERSPDHQTNIDAEMMGLFLKRRPGRVVQ